ncbi:E3 ubiquitin-protein ligase FANCL [Platysternon megacephalum]|uniref:E3 ubiquitin-protein ligase FANCL n=1 Tax=Platysternon megacephalum TaxID=55544 RepID=A0A4D9DWC9_9SAUR|nr:E3 ubiquitin-protein ligase FANCL [Platysternon megacephalum]
MRVTREEAGFGVARGIRFEQESCAASPRAGREMAGSGALLRQCPLLLPQNREGSVYEGFVTVQDRDFHIRILLPSDFQLKNAR